VRDANVSYLRRHGPRRTQRRYPAVSNESLSILLLRLTIIFLSVTIINLADGVLDLLGGIMIALQALAIVASHMEHHAR
jgi:membrane-bound ClpP family serine protease